MIHSREDQIHALSQLPLDNERLGLVALKTGSSLHKNVPNEVIDGLEVVPYVPQHQTPTCEDADQLKHLLQLRPDDTKFWWVHVRWLVTLFTKRFRWTTADSLVAPQNVW
jgi:hypothetical protein